MSDYAVHVTTDAATDLDDDTVDRLMDELAPYSAALGGGHDATHGVSAQLTVDATSIDAAARAGIDALITALGRAGIPANPVRVDVMTGEEFDRWINTPQQPADLVPTSEAATILSVSRQRILQLDRSHPAFPTAVRIRGHLYWSAAALRRFHKIRSRPVDKVPQ